MTARPPDPPSVLDLCPLFGTRCRTEGFAHASMPAGSAQYVYFEMYRDTIAADSWTVRRVTQTSNSHRGEAFMRSDPLQRLPFRDALAKLAAHEGYYSGNKAAYTPLFPNAAAMGFDHYRAFAEREGFVYDTQGRAHPRPGPGLLPPNAEFSAESIARADKNLQRPAAEFAPVPPAQKLPDTLFIFDAFNRRAIGKKQASELAGLRVLSLMDQFVRQIETINTHLHDYSGHHLKQAMETRITQAEAALVLGRNHLRQIAAYGIDTASFEKLAEECAIVINVVHAQGLYDQLRHHVGTFDNVEKLFKMRADKALALYDALAKKDNSKPSTAFAAGYKALQEMMIQGGTPSVPEALGDFVIRYREQRARLIPPAPGTGGGNTPPKPPAR